MRPRLVPELDVEEFLHWENRQSERFELQHGFIVAFAGGTFDHNTIAFNVRKALEAAYPSPCRTFGSDVKVKISDQSVFYPAAGAVCTEVPGTATIVLSPTIVCEVLSESTRAYDLIDKRAAYRRIPSLQAYLIVDTRSRRVEIDTRTFGDRWTTSAYEDGTFELGSGTISLDAIYEGTSVPSE
jgi:Uma2 family endonuclease